MPADAAAFAGSHARPPLPVSLMIGIALVLGHFLLACVGPYLVPFGPTQMGAGGPLSPASMAHPFGTDQLGRDVWSRAVHGARLVLALSLSGTALGFVLGGALGLVSGYRGGVFDAIARDERDGLGTVALVRHTVTLARDRQRVWQLL